MARPLVRLRRCRDRATWDALVNSFDESLYFHSWDWLDLQERVLRVVFERYVIEHEGTAVGIFPIGRKKSWGLTSPYLPYPFQGPLVPAHLAPYVPAALRRTQLRHGVMLGRYDVGPLVSDQWRHPLSTSSSRARERRTVVVDLAGHASGEDLLTSYARTHRRSVNRATRAGCQVRRAVAGEATELLFPLLVEGYAARGHPCPYPADVGLFVEEWARDREDVGILIAEVQGERAGLLVVLGGRPTALAWAGGCFRRFRDLSVNVLLYHHMLLWSLERGHDRIDLCAGVDNPGALRFKRSFGGELVAGLYVESFLFGHHALSAVRRCLSYEELNLEAVVK